MTRRSLVLAALLCALFLVSSISVLAQCPWCGANGCDAGLGAVCLPPGAYKTGFPVTLSGGGQVYGPPVMADLGLTPGHKSLVFGTSARKLYVVNYDGMVAAGFPVTLPANVEGSPAVGDINGDGQPDIVVGYGGTLD